MKRILALLLAFALVFSLAACTSSNTGTEPAATPEPEPEASAEPGIKDTIVYAMWSANSGVLQPALASDDRDSDVIRVVFDSLLQYDKELDAVPSMADSYDYDEENLLLTFHLRDGLKWHDGEPVTAEDVAFSFEALAHPDYTGGKYSTVETVKGAKAYHEGKADSVEGIKVIDDQTIQFEFEEVYAPVVYKIGCDCCIFAKHIWGDIPVAEWDSQADLMNHPIGCGPYKFESMVPGQYIELVANEDYWGGCPKTQKFIFKVANQDTAIAELTTGAVDIANISSLKKQDLDTLTASGIEVKSFDGVAVQYMGVNQRLDVFKDGKVAQAMTYAINRKDMIDKLLEGRAAITNAPVLPSSWAYPADGLNTYDYNVEKAKEILKEAGYEDRDGDGIVENEAGQKLSFTLSYPTGNKIREQSAPIIQSNLKDIGIEITLDIKEFAALLQQTMYGKHEFDLYLMGGSYDSADPDPIAVWHSNAISDDGGWNQVGFSDPEADKLMEEALKTTDVAERAALYKEFCKIVNEQCPWVFLYEPDTIMGYTNKLHNYDPGAYRSFPDIVNWYVEL